MLFLLLGIPSLLGAGVWWRNHHTQSQSNQPLCCPPVTISHDVLDTKIRHFCTNIVLSLPEQQNSTSKFRTIHQLRYCEKRFVEVLLGGFEHDIYDRSIMHRSLGSRSMTKKYAQKLLVMDLDRTITTSVEIYGHDINDSNVYKVHQFCRDFNEKQQRPAAVLINEEISFIRDNIMQLMFMRENFADVDILIYSKDDPFYTISNVIFLEIYYNTYWSKTSDTFQFDGVIADRTMIQKSLQRIFNHGYVLSLYDELIILQTNDDIWSDDTPQNDSMAVTIEQVPSFDLQFRDPMSLTALQTYIKHLVLSDNYLLQIASKFIMH